MITEDGRVKVTDFGIAKHSESSTITNSGRIIGSVHYFSPEQARGLTTDKRTDIYSLGIVMYEMITGRLPFDSESPVTIALKHMQEPIIPPKTINPQVSDKLNAVIMKATQKDPIDRYQSIEDMLSDIERIKSTEDLLFAVPASSGQDMENTQVMAPIKGQDIKYARRSIRRPIDNFEYDEDDYIEEEKLEKKKNRGLLLLLLGLIVALTVTSLLGYNYLMGQAEKKRIAEEQAKIIKVPTIKGMTQDRAKLELATNELSMKVVGTENSDGPGGVVLSVSPEEGSEVKKGDTVNVIVSALKESVIVPEFTDKTLDEYKELLAAAGLTVGNVADSFSSTIPLGKVISVNPTSGSEREKGTPIDISVSKGENPATATKKVKMPDITGMYLSSAKDVLSKNKLVSGDVTVIENDSPDMDNRVTDQSIPEGTEISEGTKINMVVAKYVAPATTTPPATTAPSTTAPTTSSGSGVTPFDFDQIVNKNFYEAEAMALSHGYKISILNMYNQDGKKVNKNDINQLLNDGKVDATVEEYVVSGNTIIVNVMNNY